MADWAGKNRAHFNEAASTYNTKFSKTILQIIDEIQTRRQWIGVDWIEDSSSEDGGAESSVSVAETQYQKPEKVMRLLDYACGTGLVSRALAPYVSQCVGVDISESMVNEYNTGVQNQGITKEEMHAVVGNLIDPIPSAALSGPEFAGFDIAAVGMGWHHFDNPSLAAKRLSERLKVGGVLLIIDFLPHAAPGPSHAHPHPHQHGPESLHSHDHGKGKGLESVEKLHSASHTVTHLGFSQAETREMFEEAGVGGGFEYVTLGKGVVFTNQGQEMKRNVFMARGKKL